MYGLKRSSSSMSLSEVQSKRIQLKPLKPLKQESDVKAPVKAKLIRRGSELSLSLDPKVRSKQLSKLGVTPPEPRVETIPTKLNRLLAARNSKNSDAEVKAGEVLKGMPKPYNKLESMKKQLHPLEIRQVADNADFLNQDPSDIASQMVEMGVKFDELPGPVQRLATIKVLGSIAKTLPSPMNTVGFLDTLSIDETVSFVEHHDFLALDFADMATELREKGSEWFNTLPAKVQEVAFSKAMAEHMSDIDNVKELVQASEDSKGSMWTAKLASKVSGPVSAFRERERANQMRESLKGIMDIADHTGNHLMKTLLTPESYRAKGKRMAGSVSLALFPITMTVGIATGGFGGLAVEALGDIGGTALATWAAETAISSMVNTPVNMLVNVGISQGIYYAPDSHGDSIQSKESIYDRSMSIMGDDGVIDDSESQKKLEALQENSYLMSRGLISILAQGRKTDPLTEEQEPLTSPRMIMRLMMGSETSETYTAPVERSRVKKVLVPQAPRLELVSEDNIKSQRRQGLRKIHQRLKEMEEKGVSKSLRQEEAVKLLTQFNANIDHGGKSAKVPDFLDLLSEIGLHGIERSQSSDSHKPIEKSAPLSLKQESELQEFTPDVIVPLQDRMDKPRRKRKFPVEGRHGIVDKGGDG